MLLLSLLVALCPRLPFFTFFMENFCQSSHSLLCNAHRLSLSAFLISRWLILGPCIRNHNNCTGSRWSVAVPLDPTAAKRTVNKLHKQQQQAVIIIPGGEETVRVLSLVKSFLRREAACCKLSSGPAVLEEDVVLLVVNVADVRSVLPPFQRHHTHSLHCLRHVRRVLFRLNTKRVVLFMLSLAGWTIMNFVELMDWNKVGSTVKSPLVFFFCCSNVWAQAFFLLLLLSTGLPTSLRVENPTDPQPTLCMY